MGILSLAFQLSNSLKKTIYLAYLKERLGYLGRDVQIDPTAQFRYSKTIYIGDRCRIYAGATLVGIPGESEIGLSLGMRCKVHENAFLDAYSGQIILGTNVYIGHSSIICGHGSLTIGDNTMISGLCYVIPANHIFIDSEIPLRYQGETRRGIIIGKNVWVGAGCTILDGVSIGDNAVVGAGSVVSRDIPPWAVALGIPARVVRFRQY